MLSKIFLSSILLVTALSAQDGDQDNIPDQNDLCIQTPKGVCVDSNGCTQKIKETVYFNINSFSLGDTNNETLKNILNIAQECYGYKILITGHTDSSYTEKYNKYLSKQRAFEIKSFLIKNGIDPKRIAVKFNGEETPVATNVTNEGRSLNRRTEIIFY